MKKAGTCTLGAAALAPHTHAPARAANAPGLNAEGLKTASRRWLARLCPAERVACAGDRAMQGRARGGWVAGWLVVATLFAGLSQAHWRRAAFIAAGTLRCAS